MDLRQLQRETLNDWQASDRRRRPGGPEVLAHRAFEARELYGKSLIRVCADL